MPIQNPLDTIAEHGDLDEYDDELPTGLHEVVVEDVEEDEFGDGEEALKLTLVNHDLRALQHAKLGANTQWLVRQVAKIANLRGEIHGEHLLGFRFRVRVVERDGYLNIRRFLPSKVKANSQPIAEEPLVKAAQEALGATPVKGVNADAEGSKPGHRAANDSPV